jgi:nucleoside-diphosphate-sugar epimerase
LPRLIALLQLRHHQAVALKLQFEDFVTTRFINAIWILLINIITMSRVLVLGATGFIGQKVALSLLRSGNYLVYGLARSAAKAQELAALEIIPVIGSATEPSAYVPFIKEKRIDLVINAAELGPDTRILLNALKGIAAEKAAQAKELGVRAGKLGLIYVSGTWVHGSSLERVNDRDYVANVAAPTQPCELISYRPNVEQEVLAASDLLDVVVVRPAVVYGGNNWIFSLYFNPLKEAAQSNSTSASIPADPESQIGLVHVDDVATGIHLLADKLELISGTNVHPIFDLQTSQESIFILVEAAARHLGFRGKIEFNGTAGNAFAEALSTSGNCQSGRAKAILGWEPKRIGMVHNMDLFVMSWNAAQK